jgi:hypothetical protein
VWEAVMSALAELGKQHDKAPLVVLDLDSTLIHTGARHLAIAHAYGHPEVQRALAGMSPRDFGWDVRDPLRERGVHESVLDDLLAFWQDRFFDGSWLRHDQPTEGAVAFTHHLLDAGAQLLYLTARPEPTMGAETREILPALGFPMGEGTSLRLKPSTALSDAVYKRHMTRELPRLGPVAATFENEPGHANGFLAAFPEARHYLVGDVHDPRAPAPDPRVHRIQDFRPSP